MTTGELKYIIIWPSATSKRIAAGLPMTNENKLETHFGAFKFEVRYLVHNFQ